MTHSPGEAIRLLAVESATGRVAITGRILIGCELGLILKKGKDATINSDIVSMQLSPSPCRAIAAAGDNFTHAGRLWLGVK